MEILHWMKYANLLHKDAIIEKNQYTDGFVVDREIIHSAKGTHILYVGVRMSNSLKKYGEINIKIENGKIIHLIGLTFFDIPMGNRNLFIFSSLNRNILLSFDNLRCTQE